MQNPDIEEILTGLSSWVEDRGFSGWDPYDALLSPFPFHLGGRWAEVAAIQFFKRSPLNLRSLFLIPRQANPKALGLFLEAYAKRWNQGEKQAQEICEKLFEGIVLLKSRGYSGACWGYNFPWSGPAKRLPAYYPSTVVTAIVARGLYHYYRVSGNIAAKDLLLSIPDFLLSDLEISEKAEGICFSYTPAQRDVCYNASLFAAETLALCDRLSKTEVYKKQVLAAVEYVLAQQKVEGVWMYSQNPLTGDERSQIDFHQGYILDSIFHIKQCYAIREERWDEAIKKGAEYYFKKQFSPDGRSLRRLPRKWPADIHAQAQGIITFSLLGNIDPCFRPFAKTIAEWTIRNMYDRKGCFYYQKYPFLTIKTPYMRWAQAWMMKALVDYKAVD